jgi:DNA-binding IclR family transcriptional regulator
MNNSVIRAADCLEALAKSKKPRSLKDLAAATQLDKATAYRLLSALCGKQLVQKVGENGHYALGPACLALGEAFRKSFAVRDRVLPHLEKLVEATGETAIYCERFQDDSCVTVERWESPNETRTTSMTGIPRPLYAGCSGRAILAMLPDGEIRSLLKGKPLVRYTRFSPATARQLMNKINETRRQGYAVSVQERNLFTAGVAAPVFDYGSVIGCLAVIGLAERIKESGIEKMGRSVRKVADRLSQELGFKSGAASTHGSRGERTATWG